MAVSVKSAADGTYQIVDAFGNVLQDGIEDLGRARAIAATRNAVGDEGQAEHPEGEQENES